MSNNIGKRILSMLLSAALVLGLLATAPVTASAYTADELVPIINSFAHGGSGTGLYAEVTDTNEVTVSGEVTGAAATLYLNIDADVTVKWGAEYSGTTGDPVYNLINLSGDGTFEVIAGGLIVNDGPFQMIMSSNGENVTIIVSGGMVQTTGDGGVAIHADDIRSTVTVSGGTVSATGDNGTAISSNGSVNISGTAQVSATGDSGDAINVGGPSSTATVSGGLVQAANGKAIYTNNANAEVIEVIIEGGIVQATAAGGYGIYANAAKAVTVNDGTVTAIDTGKAIYLYDNNANVYIYGGTIKANDTSAGSVSRITGMGGSGRGYYRDNAYKAVFGSGFTVDNTVNENATLVDTINDFVHGGTATTPLTATQDGNIVTVTGVVTGVTNTLTLNTLQFTSGITVKWGATLSGTANPLIELTGNGTFEVVADGSITNSTTSSNAIHATGANTKIIVSGGTVQTSAGGGRAIYATGANAEIIVCGGTVKATNNTGDAINASQTGSKITVSSGTVEATGNRAIYANGTVIVSDGTVQATTGEAICAVSTSAKIIINGGTVQATGAGGKAVNLYGGSLYYSGGTIQTSAGNAISRTDGVGYYIGDNEAKFTGFTAGTNLHKLDAVALTANGVPYTYASGATTYDVVATLSDKLAATSITAANATGTEDTDAGTFTITQPVDSQAITLTVAGSITGLDIPVSFTTAAFGVRKTTDITGSAQVSVGGTYTYTGLPQTPAASNVTVTLGGDTLTHIIDYTYALTAGGTSAGTATVTVTGTGLYSGMATGTFTIGPAPLAVSGGTVASKPYDGGVAATVTEVTFGSLQNSETLALTTDYTVTGAAFGAADAGVGKTVTATVALTSTARASNYSLPSGAFSVTNGEITAAAAFDGTTPTITRNVPNGAVRTVTIPLSELTPTPASGKSLGTVNSYTLNGYAAGNVSDSATISGGNLVITSKNNPINTSVSENITVKVATQNYGDISVTVTLQTINKNDVSANITFNAPANKTYTGTEQTITEGEKATISGITAAGTPVWTYTYAANGNGASLSGDNKPLTAGSYTVTAAYEDEDNIGSKPQSFIIDRKDASALTIDPIAGVTYTGGALTPAITVKDGLTTLNSPADYTVDYANNTSAGTATVTITGAGNYTDTKTASFTINKATPALLTWPTAAGVTYGAALSTSTLSGGSTTGTWAWTNGTVIPTVTNSGYEVTFTPTDTANYDWTGVTVKQNVSIAVSQSNALSVVTQPTMTATVSVSAKTYTFIMDNISLNHADTGAKTYSAVEGADTNNILSNIQVSNNTLSYDIANTAAAGNTATITITIASANYSNITAMLTITVVAKNAQAISFTGGDETRTYGEAGFTKTAALQGSGGTGAITYASNITNVATVNVNTGAVTIAGAGTATITAIKAEDDTYAEATATYTLTVNRKPITWNTLTANGNSGTVDTTALTLTFNAEPVGLAIGDITVTGATADSLSGSGNTRTLAISGITVTNGANMTVTLTDPANHTITPKTMNVAVNVAKKAGAAVSGAPTEAGKTAVGITVNAVTLTTATGQMVEYAISTTATEPGGGGWQETLVFSGLTPNTTYYVFARSKADASYSAGTAQMSAITTNMAQLSGTVAISGNAIFGQTLTAVATGLTTNPSGIAPGTLSYQWQRGGSNIGANSATYTLVQADIGGIITVMVSAANCTGDITSAAGVGPIAKATQAAPVLNFTFSGTTVTITFVSGAEYKFESDSDATQNWSGTNTYNFTSGAALTLYIRLAGTATHEPSNEVTQTVDTALPTPNAPDAFTLTISANGDTNYTVTIPATTGAEYSFNGTNWDSTTRTTTALPGETVTGYKRIAAEAGASNASGISSASVTLPAFKVQIPTANPNGGSFTTSQSITLNCATVGASIYYTLDGSAPHTGSTPYSGAFILTNTTTVKAIAVKGGLTNSDILTVTFTKAAATYEPGGGGGGTNASQTAPAVDGTVKVEYSQSSGAVTLALPESKLNEIIGKADGTATIDLSGVKNATAAALPKAALGKLADAGLEVALELPQGTLTLDEAAAKSIASQATGTNVSVQLNQTAPSSLTSAQQEAIKEGDLVFNISASSGSQNITEFEGTLTVSVPYSGPLPAGVWYLNSTGHLEQMDCTYNAATGTVSFTLAHLSLYVVRQDKSALPAPAWANPFTDVFAGDWFYASVKFTHQNGLFSGATATTFSPGTPMTRAMIVTILYRHAGSPNVSWLDNTFGDVAEGKYYTNAVKWAAAKGIVAGYGGKYDPEANITRQDLAVILMHYADFAGIELPITRDYPDFFDNADIANYAKDAIEQFFRAGIIGGKPGNQFDPKGPATRAEAAAMLHKLLEAVK